MIVVVKQEGISEKVQSQPVNVVYWIHRSQLRANSYNPNNVAPVELDQLEISIHEDGWTQPIVARFTDEPDVFEIVDGFHRWLISERPKVFALTDGFIPVTLIDPNTSYAQQQMATIRHNRARGQHYVASMARIINDLLTQGVTSEEISKRLGMDGEEIDRLYDYGDMIKRHAQDGFGNGWVPSLDKAKS